MSVRLGDEDEHVGCISSLLSHANVYMLPQSSNSALREFFLVPLCKKNQSTIQLRPGEQHLLLACLLKTSIAEFAEKEALNCFKPVNPKGL